MSEFATNGLSFLTSKNIIQKNGSPVLKESLNGKTIGLYFSAHWCPPCRLFTPQLAAKYKELKDAGKSFEIIFISADRDEDAASEYFKDMPWTMLSFADRVGQTELSEKYEIQGIPALILLDSDGELITKEGRDAVMNIAFEDYKNFEAIKREAEEKAATELELLRQSFKPSTYFLDCVKNKDKQIVPASDFSGKLVGLYFSAHWCGPCRTFTPQLAAKYKTLISEGKSFEIIFISSDRDEAGAETYFEDMPWTMLSFHDREKKKALSELFDISGIPSLVILDDDGLITKDGRSAIMNCPYDDLKTFEEKKKLAAEELDRKNSGYPEQVIHECHPHPLIKMPRVYGGHYGCDICGSGGQGWVYHCGECGFDAHPSCCVAAI